MGEAQDMEIETFDSPYEDDGGADNSQIEDYGVETFDDDFSDEGINETLTETLDDDEGTREEPKEKEVKKEEVKTETEEVEEKEEPKYKTVKGKVGEDSLDIAEEATVKVSVDGKDEFPTVRELMNNYSGVKKWTEEITSAKNEARTVRHEKQVVDNDKAELMGHVDKIGDMMDKALSGEISPLSAMEYFLDLTGRSAYEYNKLMVDNMTPIVNHLNESSEEGREAFWLKIQNEHLRSSHAAKAEKAKNSENLKEQSSKLERLRESQGISNEQFVIAAEELKEMSPDKEWSSEEVVKYLGIKPLYESAYSVSSQYADLFQEGSFDGVQDKLVDYMQEFPEHTEEDIKEILFDALDLEPIAKTLEEKVERTEEPTTRKRKKAESIDDIELFDDFDY